MASLAVILGAGPVGQSVARRFRDLGWEVRVVTRSGASGLQGVPAVQVDVRDAQALKRASEGASVLVHAVGVPYQNWASDLPLMQDALLAAAGTKAITVFAENLYSYQPTFPLKEDTPEVPPSKKGALRLRLSQQWQAAHREGRIRGVAVRASDYWGPGATTSANSTFGARFFPNLEAGRPVSFVGNPLALHSYTYLPDFARALVDVALDSSSWGQSWIAPSLAPTTAQAVSEAFAAEAGRPVAVRRLSKAMLNVVGLFSPLVKELGEMLYQFDHDFIVDSSAFEAHFGWKATDLDQAIRETWADHRR